MLSNEVNTTVCSKMEEYEDFGGKPSGQYFSECPETTVGRYAYLYHGPAAYMHIGELVVMGAGNFTPSMTPAEFDASRTVSVDVKYEVIVDSPGSRFLDWKGDLPIGEYGWYGGHSHLNGWQGLSWEDARHQCEVRGMKIAAITSYAEQVRHTPRVFLLVIVVAPHLHDLTSSIFHLPCYIFHLPSSINS